MLDRELRKDYNSDRAVLSEKEDLLERKNLARQLATTISLFNNNDALTIV